MKDPLISGTVAMILAGGAGERLYPLTRDRAKPAVPFGGMYRIVDFTLSNCVNSDLRRIHLLTQYKSFSLNRHVRLGWDIFNIELGEYLEVNPPEQRTVDRFYQGTADAIFQNLYTLEQVRPERVLILSGDHVYRMDYREMLRFHVEKGTAITLGCVVVPEAEASRFGILQVDRDFRVVDFVEKPDRPQALPGQPGWCLASMGVYIFNTHTLVRSVIEDMRRDTAHDFGRDILPQFVGTGELFAFSFCDPRSGRAAYWRDIGTLDSYHAANMELLGTPPVFSLHEPGWPLRTYQRQRPPIRIADSDGSSSAQVRDSLISSGCVIAGGTVERSILSPSVQVCEGARVEGSILFDDVVIGPGAKVRQAILDKAVHVPPGAEVGYDPEADAQRFTVTGGGITVVPRGMMAV